MTLEKFDSTNIKRGLLKDEVAFPVQSKIGPYIVSRLVSHFSAHWKTTLMSRRADRVAFSCAAFSDRFEFSNLTYFTDREAPVRSQELLLVLVRNVELAAVLRHVARRVSLQAN